MANLFGQIDITKLGDFVRQNPEAVKNVTFRDGTVHKIISISISERREADNYGNDHYAKIYVPKDKVKQGVNYYIADLKSSQTRQQAQVQQNPAPAPLPLPESPLPQSEPITKQNPLPTDQQPESELPF